MAQKNNIRSIRFSDELAELIDRQVVIPSGVSALRKL